MVPVSGLITTIMGHPSEEKKFKLQAPIRLNHTKNSNILKLIHIFSTEILQPLFYKELQQPQIISPIEIHLLRHLAKSLVKLLEQMDSPKHRNLT